MQRSRTRGIGSISLLTDGRIRRRRVEAECGHVGEAEAADGHWWGWRTGGSQLGCAELHERLSSGVRNPEIPTIVKRQRRRPIERAAENDTGSWTTAAG